MKAATGELNLTVITLIAIGAVIGFFWMMWPNIQNSINDQWNDVSSNNRNTQSKNRSQFLLNFIYSFLLR